MVRDAAGKIPTVFDAVDCVSMFEERRRNVLRNPLLRLFSWTEWKKMLYWERMACQLFDQVVISSSVDRDLYPKPRVSRNHPRVIPNGVDLDYFRFREFRLDGNLIVFCAKLDYFANSDAALHFARVIWPVILANRPTLELRIVGSMPPSEVRRLDGKNNIQVIGSVPDVRPFLGRASIALCPVRVRAGIQMKILEALAAGVPVVASSICCPGLGLESGKHLLTADTPQSTSLHLNCFWIRRRCGRS